MNTPSSDWIYAGMWLGSAVIVAFLGYMFLPASLVDGVYVPAGNDAFYHATRIIESATRESGFYQFDDKIHVPEGSWLTWPWAYDYLLTVSLRFALFVNPDMESMKFLAYVPVFWSFVNMGLFTLLTRELRLHIGLAAVAIFAFSISGLVVFLHAVGNIDHHGFELSFTLATVWAALRFFREGSRPSDGAVLGIVLGMAPAFHNILFVLQIPVVAAVLLNWFKGRAIATASANRLAIALLATTLIFLLPSETFQNFFFEYTTHSWFHLYIAFGTSAVIVALSRIPFTPRNLGGLAIGGLVLASPLIFQIVHGLLYVSGDSVLLDVIDEVKGPLRRYLDHGRTNDVTLHYSWLIVLAPVMWLAFAWRAFSERAPDQVYLAVAAVFSLTLLFMQFRMHPFGSWALVLCPFVLLNEFSVRKHWHTGIVATAALGAVAIASQPTLHYRFFKVPSAGMSRQYESSRFIYPSLAEVCAKDPGVVLAYSNEGHYVRYHSDCSVIANNFLLTKQHGQKIAELHGLLNMEPEDFLAADHDVKYVLLRLFGLWDDSSGTPEPRDPADMVSMNARLFLNLVARNELPDGFERLHELRVDDERDIVFAALYRVVKNTEGNPADDPAEGDAEAARLPVAEAPPGIGN